MRRLARWWRNLNWNDRCLCGIAWRLGLRGRWYRWGVEWWCQRIDGWAAFRHPVGAADVEATGGR